MKNNSKQTENLENIVILGLQISNYGDVSSVLRLLSKYFKFYWSPYQSSYVWRYRYTKEHISYNTEHLSFFLVDRPSFVTQFIRNQSLEFKCKF